MIQGERIALLRQQTKCVKKEVLIPVD